MRKFKFTIISFLYGFAAVFAQTVLPFYSSNEVTVFNNNKLEMSAPFAGGFSAPQFSDVDLNNDGIKDLVVFDRRGDKISTFLNGGTVGKVDYRYAPEYEAQFPERIEQWIKLLDYNNDGIEDIFTYSTPGGIKLYKSFYKNDSIKFTLVTNVLEYESQSGFPLNIYVSPADMPAFADVDLDGDIDVLTFEQFLGSNLEWYKNVAVEYNLPNDSLYFIKEESCWGNFLENAYNSVVTLDACDGLKLNRQNLASKKHPGSSVLAFDYDGDTDMDLLLGDVSSTNLNFLLNGGSTDDALITQAYNWPNNENALDTYLYLAAFSLDIDNDGLLDVVCATNTTQPSETKNHISWYKNISNDSITQYTHHKENFFTQDVLDFGANSYPAVVDFDNDGLMDIAVGVKNYFNRVDSSEIGIMAMLKNVSTPNKIAFELVDTNFNNLYNLKLLGIRPAFGDIDGDGDADMITGDNKGFLHYFENVAPANEPMQLQLNTPNIDSITIGANAAPTLYDYNNDGLLDLICGERGGAFHYLKNISINNELKFSYEDNFMGIALIKEDGETFGYSAPTIVIEDSTKIAYIIANNYSGNLYLINNLSNYKFTINDELFNNITTAGEGGGVAVYDFDNDGFLEMLIGNVNGGLNFFSQKNEITSATTYHQNAVKIYPNPATTILNITNTIYTFSSQIFDCTGKLIDEKESIKNKLNIQHLSKGLYILRLQNKEHISFQRFIKH